MTKKNKRELGHQLEEAVCYGDDTTLCFNALVKAINHGANPMYNGLFVRTTRNTTALYEILDSLPSYFNKKPIGGYNHHTDYIKSIEFLFQKIFEHEIKRLYSYISYMRRSVKNAEEHNKNENIKNFLDKDQYENVDNYLKKLHKIIDFQENKLSSFELEIITNCKKEFEKFNK